MVNLVGLQELTFVQETKVNDRSAMVPIQLPDFHNFRKHQQHHTMGVTMHKLDSLVLNTVSSEILLGHHIAQMKEVANWGDQATIRINYHTVKIFHDVMV